MPLVILAIGILVLFFLIVKVKLNSFLALLLVAASARRCRRPGRRHAYRQAHPDH